MRRLTFDEVLTLKKLCKKVIKQECEKENADGQPWMDEDWQEDCYDKAHRKTDKAWEKLEEFLANATK